jgi:hypothetical protein
MTLNRSKSFSAFRLSIDARDLAKALSFHFFSTLSLAHLPFSAACPMPSGSLSMTMWVRAMFERGAAWRGTSLPFWLDGPSTSTFYRQLFASRTGGRLSIRRLTRLWSMISTITAILDL